MSLHNSSWEVLTVLKEKFDLTGKVVLVQHILESKWFDQCLRVLSSTALDWETYTACLHPKGPEFDLSDWPDSTHTPIFKHIWLTIAGKDNKQTRGDLVPFILSNVKNCNCQCQKLSNMNYSVFQSSLTHTLTTLIFNNFKKVPNHTPPSHTSCIILLKIMFLIFGYYMHWLFRRFSIDNRQ